MKRIILTAAMIASIISAKSQIYIGARGGVISTTEKAIYMAGSANFTAKGFGISPEIFINTSDNYDAGGGLGVSVSYQYKFVEVGYGQYFFLYNTDKYHDPSVNFPPNGFKSSYHVTVFFAKWMDWDWYFKYNYIDNHNSIGIGARVIVGNLSN